jgi:purine-binding chemotaxis protein CheW
MESEGMKSSGSYLTIKMDKEIFAVDINDFKEIRGFSRINRVAPLPKHLIGFTEVRFFQIPVFDLRTRLGLQEAPITGNSCLLILEAESNGKRPFIISYLIDTFPDIIQINQDEIQKLPKSKKHANKNHITGIVSTDQGTLQILDTSRLITMEELLLVMSNYINELDIPLSMYKQELALMPPDVIPI